MDDAPQETFHRGGQAAGQGGEPAVEVPMQAPGEAHRQAQVRPPHQAGQDRPDGAGIGQGPVHREAEVGPPDGDHGKEEVQDGQILARGRLQAAHPEHGGIAVGVGHEQEKGRHLDEGKQQLHGPSLPAFL